MKHIQASEAKAKFSELLDQVERGETIVITRHGKVIARLTPPDAEKADKVRNAVRELKELRKDVKPATVEEILAWRDEGRRF
mgnify:FL=1